MQLRGSQYSCGIYELTDVHGWDDPKLASYGVPTEALYQDAINRCFGSVNRYPRCAYITASVTKGQQIGVEFLRKLGFDQITEWKRNPNSANEIALFVKAIEKPGEPLPSVAQIPDGKCDGLCGNPYCKLNG